MSESRETLARIRGYRQVLENLSRIGGEIMPPERLMQHVAAQVSRVTHIDRVKVMRHRPHRGDLLIEAGVGWRPGVVGEVALAIDYRSPAGRAFQTGAPVAIANLLQAPEFTIPDVLREHGIVAMLNAPVMINGLTWGILEIDSTEPQCFDEWDVSFLSILANMMGTCIALYDVQKDAIDQQGQRERDRARSTIAVRELQHRIKNNLQIIVAFLTLKIREMSPDVREKLNSVISRVQAIALAHDLLSLGAKTGSLDFASYLSTLCANIPDQRGIIDIEVDAEHYEMPIDRAVPAGLIVNELVTNSIKYAFGNDGGKIQVQFVLVSDLSEGCITVQDNGRGIDIPPKRGFGLTLIEGLAQQLQGRLEFLPAEVGTQVKVYFPVSSPDREALLRQPPSQ